MVFRRGESKRTLKIRGKKFGVQRAVGKGYSQIYKVQRGKEPAKGVDVRCLIEGHQLKKKVGEGARYRFAQKGDPNGAKENRSFRGLGFQVSLQ